MCIEEGQERGRSQWLRALAAPLENPGSSLIIYTVVHSHLNSDFRGSKALIWLLQAPGLHVVHGHICNQNTYTHKNKMIIKKNCTEELAVGLGLTF